MPRLAAPANGVSSALSAWAVFALALPFLWCFTRPPSTNFWPLAASWLCAAALLLLSAAQGLVGMPWSRRQWARLVACGLLLAALVSGGVGLAQYVGWDKALLPWVYDAPVGQAMGNLRQRNQQATLLSMGVWALLWWAAQRGLAGAGTRTWQAAMWAAMGFLAVGSAATASRTGLLQWLLLASLTWLWRKRLGAGACRLLAAGMALYLLASWALPELLWRGLGVQGSGVFTRVTASYGCGSRRVLWSNVLDLIALRPWFGWGWGELDYAHYVTLFQGARFCALLDNAHNLPLHLAVTLGLPAALLLCCGAAALVWRARPWEEVAPERHLAWGVLLVVAAHSMLEFPLWYGPFQLAALSALVLLWPRPAVQKNKQNWTLAQYLKAFAAIGLVALVVWVARQYAAVGQLYQPLSERSMAIRRDAQGRVAGAPLFDDAARFAHLTSLEVTRANAAQVHALARSLLHYSPEPRVIERLIDSAELLGLADEAEFHRLRYAAAYPTSYARWTRGEKASGPLAD